MAPVLVTFDSASLARRCRYGAIHPSDPGPRSNPAGPTANAWAISEKPVYGYVEYAQDGSHVVSATTGGDHHYIYASLNDQTLTSISNDMMTGNVYRENFVFTPGFGQDEVTDLVLGGRGHDYVGLINTGFSNLTQVLRHTKQTAGGVVIHIDQQDTIKIDGVTKTQLRAHQGDFYFG